jgi:hypothetical protein
MPCTCCLLCLKPCVLQVCCSCEGGGALSFIGGTWFGSLSSHGVGWASQGSQCNEPRTTNQVCVPATMGPSTHPSTESAVPSKGGLQGRTAGEKAHHILANQYGNIEAATKPLATKWQLQQGQACLCGVAIACASHQPIHPPTWAHAAALTRPPPPPQGLPPPHTHTICRSHTYLTNRRTGWPSSEGSPDHANLQLCDASSSWTTDPSPYLILQCMHTATQPPTPTQQCHQPAPEKLIYSVN